MAKKFYISNGGLSKEAKKWYVPVNGVSKKVTKVYCSVNGLSKLFFGNGVSPLGTSWWYETVNRTFLSVTNKSGTTYTYSKDNMGIAYWAVITKEWSANVKLSFVILASPDPSAVLFRRNDGDTYYSNVYVTVNNEQWYYAIGRIMAEVASATPNYILPTTYQGEAEWGDIIEDFVSNYVYANDFSQNYQVEQSYHLNICNMENALRKTIGIFLYKNIGKISNWTSYLNLLSNIDTVVNYVKGDMQTGNHSTGQIVIAPFNNGAGFVIYVRYNNFDEVSTILQAYYDNDGYDSFTIGSRPFTYVTEINFTANGGITHNYRNVEDTSGALFIGQFIPSYMIQGAKQVWSSNIGLNL